MNRKKMMRQIKELSDRCGGFWSRPIVCRDAPMEFLFLSGYKKYFYGLQLHRLDEAHQTRQFNVSAMLGQRLRH